MKKEFKTTQEIITDPIFLRKLTEEVSDISSKRYSRKDPPPGYYYERNELDRLHERGQLSTKFFLDNIVKIWEKKSDLSSASRRIIYDTCGKAIFGSIMEYEK